MSQAMTPQFDIFADTFTPTPISSQLAAHLAVSANLDNVIPSGDFDIGVGSPGAGSYDLTGDVHISWTLSYIGVIPGGGISWSLTVHSSIFGDIPELSFSGTGAWTGQSATVPLATLLATYGTTADIFIPALDEIIVNFNGLYSGGDSGTATISDLIYTVPDFVTADEIELNEDGTPTFEAIDGGIEFDGDPVIVESADASGIYTLVLGQKYDIIYTRTVNPDDTQQVQIPDPFIQSAFLGG